MRCALLLLGLLGLSACVQTPVQPSPTSDQVLAAQYRARGGQGAMSGTETRAVMDAYKRDIAKPAESVAGSGSMFNGGDMRSH